MKFLLPADVFLLIPDMSNTVMIPVAHSFHEWCWDSQLATVSAGETLMFVQMQLRDERGLHDHVRRLCSKLVYANLQIASILRNFRRLWLLG